MFFLFGLSVGLKIEKSPRCLTHEKKKHDDDDSS